MTLRQIFIGSAGIRAGWSLAIFAAVVAIEIGIINLVAKALHAPHFSRAGEIPPLSILVTEVSFVITIAIPTFVMSRIERRPFLAYGYSGPHKLARFAAGLATGFVAIVALIGILVLSHAIAFDSRALSAGTAIASGLVWAVIFILVGFAEESWLRGYVLFTLARGINFFWAAIIVSLLFGFIHSSNPGESPFGLINAGIISLIFCFSVWLTGSLWWAVGIHAAWDWTQSYFFGVADSGLHMRGYLLATHPTGNVWLSGGTTGPEASVFVLAILLLITLGLYMVWGRKPALRDKGSLFAQSSS